MTEWPRARSSRATPATWSFTSCGADQAKGVTRQTRIAPSLGARFGAMPAERALERRVVTALFADLAGFTTLGDSLDPEDLRAVQDAYFAAARETLERYGGLLEKYIGDAVVALFGVPRARDDDAERAVRAGLALVGAVEQLGATVGLEPSALRVRVGVNTGEVLHGEEGPERGAATGDGINVAARLQAAAEPGTVLVGEETALAVEAAIELDPPQELELKGKARVVRARRALSVRPEPSREHAVGSLCAPLLGREEELRTLGGADGRCLVVAPPGVGKTRLVEEYARRLDGTLVSRARLRPETRAPHPAVAQLVLSALPADVRELGAAEALVRERLAAAGATDARAEVVLREIAAVAWPGAAGSSDRDRDALFAAWMEGLAALAGGRPALWIVEDVHWAGPDLLAFLEHAAGGQRRVLATARPSLLEREPAWCAGAEVLHLPPLRTAEIGELVRALVGEALPVDLVDRIAARADGNPLFVEELLRSWISVGVLARDGAGWRMAVAQEVVPLPTTVQSIYAAQIDDLPEPARAVTRHASVAGRRFPAAGLPALDVPEGRAGVDVLVRRALVAGPLPDPLGDSFSFRHALLRDAAYTGLARRDRARLHVSYARWLEAAAGTHVDELAESIGGHYAAALENTPALAAEVTDGLDRRTAAVLAARWLEGAALAAVDLAAHETAGELLRRSLRLTPDELVLDRSRRWRLLAEATVALADMDEAERAARTAFELASPALGGGDEARRTYAAAAAALGRVLYEQLRFHDMLQMAEEGVAELRPVDDAATGRLHLVRALAKEGVGREVEERLPDVERALALARECGDDRLEFEARLRLTFERVNEGEAGVDECDALARLALERGEWRQSVRAANTTAMLLVGRGCFPEAAEALARGAEVAEAHDLKELLGWNTYTRVESGLVSGAWDEATAAALAAIEAAEQNAHHRVVVRTWSALVPILGARGDRPLLERARDWYAAQGLTAEHAKTISPFAHVMTLGVECVFARAELAAAPAPDPEICLPHVTYAGGMPSWLAAVEELLGLWAEHGEDGLVRGALERRAAARVGEPRALLHGHGIDELIAARLDRDPAAAREALRLFRELGAPWWQAKALRLLEALGDGAAGAEAASIECGLGAGDTG